jgi:group I intron endonuclease
MITQSGIYRIIDTQSGRFYIGSSVNMEKRWSQHQRRMELGEHPNPRLQAIWNIDRNRLAFKVFQVVPVGTKEALLAGEQLALDAAGVGTNPLCMNVLAVAGSHLGRKRTEATKAAMSAAQRGKRHSAEARAKMRAAKVGRPLSETHRRKLGDAARGRKLPPRERLPRPQLRRFIDEEVRAIRAAKGAGASYSQLEVAHGISRGALQRMLARKTYAEVV